MFQTPPFTPLFFNGVPSGTAAVGTIAYDFSTTPYTEYVFRSAAWHQTGPSSGGLPAGGTAGNLLLKNSGTDGDASWVNGEYDSANDPFFSSVKLLIGVAGTTITDFETTPKTITLVGGATTSNAIKPFTDRSVDLSAVGSALSFAASTDFNADAVGGFTWETWLYPHNVNGADNNIIFDNRTPGVSTSGIVLIVQSNLTLGVYQSGFIASSFAGSITNDHFMHIALCAFQSQAWIFVNGAQYSTFALGAVAGSPNPFRVGISNDSASGLEGYYDQIRVTKGVCRYGAFRYPSIEFPHQ